MRTYTSTVLKFSRDKIFVVNVQPAKFFNLENFRLYGIIAGYYNNIIIIIQRACAYIQYRGSLPYARIICTPDIYVAIRKAWAENIAIEWLPRTNIEGQSVDYIKIESENQKSSLIILLVLFHSACPYKKLLPEVLHRAPKHLFIYLNLIFFSRNLHTK